MTATATARAPRWRRWLLIGAVICVGLWVRVEVRERRQTERIAALADVAPKRDRMRREALAAVAKERDAARIEGLEKSRKPAWPWWPVVWGVASVGALAWMLRLIRARRRSIGRMKASRSDTSDDAPGAVSAAPDALGAPLPDFARAQREATSRTRAQ